MDKVLLKESINNKDNLLLYFKADWCGSCKESNQYIKKISESKKDFKLHEIESDEDRDDIGALFKVEFLPTLIIINETGYKKYVGTKKIKDLTK
jgi:thioredoxin-like negative regulator of GroEL